MNKEEISKSIDEGLKILKQEPSFIFNLEEIEAIQYLQIEIIDIQKNIDFHLDKENIIFKEELKAKQTILSLISKLQKENEKLKKQSEISAKTHIKNDDLKDKVIDKMAKTIAGLQLYDFGRKEYFTLEDEGEVREYFYKKVSE